MPAQVEVDDQESRRLLRQKSRPDFLSLNASVTTRLRTRLRAEESTWRNTERTDLNPKEWDRLAAAISARFDRASGRVAFPGLKSTPRQSRQFPPR